MNSSKEINKSHESEETKLLFQYLLPNYEKKCKANKSIKKDSILIPSIAIKNKKRSKSRNFSALKVNEFILFRDTSKQSMIGLKSSKPHAYCIRKNNSIENLESYNTYNKNYNFPIVNNNEFNGNRFSNKKKEKKYGIRPISSYISKVNEERRQTIDHKDLFNSIKNNYQFKLYKLKKFPSRVSIEESKNSKTNKIMLKQKENNGINIRKKLKDKDKKRKEEQEKILRIEEKNKEKKRKEEEKIRIEEEKKKKEAQEKKKRIKEKLKKENKLPKKPNSIFDKSLCDEIVFSLPKREETTLKEFKKLISTKTEKLSEKEKAFVLFKWISQNIDYDVKNFNLGKEVDCSKEGVFKTGKTICSGYSNLYQDIAQYLDLNVVCIPCYAKGADYIPGEKITASSTNHEYNAIYLDEKWYPIDATWGAGYSNGNEYIREFHEFYFLADPEILIKTHFPSDEKWQLTEKTYTLSEFEKWPQIFSNFYQYGFTSFYPEEGCLELKNTNSTQFILYGENMKKKGVMCSIYLLSGNNKEKKMSDKLSLINFYNDRIEINCSFNKKGKYLISLLGSEGDSLTHTSIISFTVKVAKNSKNIMSYPETYDDHELINIIEPLNVPLKSGKKIKFKMESNIKKIFISGDDLDEILVKNKDGFFEKDIIIGKSGGKIKIGKSDDYINDTYYVYDIV